MQILDWTIVAGLLIVLLIGALSAQRRTKSVSAFLAADRCGGRYLISMANAMAGLGVISLVYWFEMYYENGFTAFWWGAMTEPALIFLALSGFVIYRFRQTRALTLAQFFEMRYSRNFRVFAGLVAFISGIINFGIFPAVGARFFIALCGFPDFFYFLGFEILTFAAIMMLLLAVSLFFTFLGGQVAVMVTDFLQGVFANVVFAIVMIYLLTIFDWDQISTALLKAPEGKSLINPMDIGKQDAFNIWFYIISVVVVLYGVMGWQGAQGYNCCAKNAHEAKMAGILNGWRFRVLLLIGIVVPIAIHTLMKHPDFATQAAAVQHSIDSIDAGTPEEITTLQKQLLTPYALAVMLPVGLLGLMCAAMLAAFISTHDTYLHSWGVIFIQDVILPFRKNPLSTREHLWYLRLSIFCVALFILDFSLLYKPTQYIAMFLAITGAVFVGGAGSAIIGGLYWKRGTVYGAWAAMITGMVLASGGIILKQLDSTQLDTWLGSKGFIRGQCDFIRDGLTGQDITYIAIVCAVSIYLIVSLLGPRSVCDFDWLFKRGTYTNPDEAPHENAQQSWLKRLGIDPEFTGWDKVVTYLSVGWPLIWTLIFVGGTILSLIYKIDDAAWLSFWHGWLWFSLLAAIVVTIWFTIGGAKDLIYMYRHLDSSPVDESDDGRVVRPDDDDDVKEGL